MEPTDTCTKVIRIEWFIDLHEGSTSHDELFLNQDDGMYCLLRRLIPISARRILIGRQHSSRIFAWIRSVIGWRAFGFEDRRPAPVQTRRGRTWTLPKAYSWLRTGYGSGLAMTALRI